MTVRWCNRAACNTWFPSKSSRETSRIIDMMRAAETKMSLRKAGSRRIQDLGIPQDVRANPRLQSVLGDEVHFPPEQHCEFVLHGGELE